MKASFSEAVEQVGHLVDLWLPLKIQYDETPGTSVGIVYKGKLLYGRGFGFADIQKRKKADEKTLYRIASISKVFTTIAILQLVEAGKLRLDDKVTDYVDWFQAKTKHADAKNITIRQVLSHTAGLFRDGTTPHWETGKFPKDLRNSFSKESLVLENVTGFKYTNYGFSVLGALIEKISGMEYTEYMNASIVGKLGLTNTHPDYRDDLSNIATGYGRMIPREKRKVFSHYKTYAYAPATGFVSNVIDLTKLISSFSLASKGSKIIGREHKKEMMRAHEKTERGAEYGLGLEICQVADRKIIGHSGGFHGFITQVAFDPANDVGVIVLSNALGSSACEIAFGILESIYSFIDKRTEYSSSKKIHHAMYEGIYRNVWGDEIIGKLGDSLIGFSPYIDSPLQKRVLLEPTGKPHCFIMRIPNVFDARDEIAEFIDFKNGKAQEVIFGSHRAKRIKVS